MHLHAYPYLWLYSKCRFNFYNTGDVQCFGGDCYALAFGVPAVLMMVALGKIMHMFRFRAQKNDEKIIIIMYVILHIL